MNTVNHGPFRPLDPLKYACKAFFTQWVLTLCYVLFFVFISYFLFIDHSDKFYTFDMANTKDYLWVFFLFLMCAYGLAESSLNLYDTGKIFFQKSKSHGPISLFRGSLSMPLLFFPELFILGFIVVIFFDIKVAAFRFFLYFMLFSWRHLACLAPSAMYRETSLIDAEKESFQICSEHGGLLFSTYCIRLFFGVLVAIVSFLLVSHISTFFYGEHVLSKKEISVIISLAVMIYIWVVSFSETFMYRKLVDYKGMLMGRGDNEGVKPIGHQKSVNE
ncbi:MAG: hypothetical protein NT124_05145 [Candidatus Dependentiae bacterium]|nr:hypothetical protein [Candidatus Dependentiae bacterium]